MPSKHSVSSDLPRGPDRGKRVKHRVVRLYTPVTLNNAPFDFIFGVDKLYVFVRESPMMDLIIFIISV